MIFDALEVYKRIKVGDKIRIKDKYLSPNNKVISVPLNFIKYVEKNGNVFTITNLQLLPSGDVLISVWEIRGLLEYKQVKPIKSGLVLNWKKHSNSKMEA
jgi:hypothetical protein